jgi:citrate synthase
MTGYRTSVGTSDSTSITVLGQDLAGELLGRVGFAELAFWLVASRRPGPGELRLFEAVLVALTDHGLTPSALAARLTLTGAPESLQGAVAAGLLGGGSRYLGVTEDTGRLLAAGLSDHTADGKPLPDNESDWDDLARAVLTRERDAGRRVPGLGHPQHKTGDPRTPALFAVAAQEGLLGPHLRLLEAIGRVHPEVLGRTLPVNGAGVCGAALCDLGFGVDVLRGFALLARCAGLLGHLAEEQRHPIGQQLANDVHASTEYVPPGT